MLATSKDLFWIIFSLSLGLFTIFTCWAIYYLVMILRNANKMMSSVREKIELVDKILKLVRDKLEKSSSHLSVIADSVIKLVGFMMERQQNTNKKRKNP